jgi:nucleoside-diphosphate-sugar epimerase
MGTPVRAVVTGGGGFGVRCITGDLADPASVREALLECDVVFHVAAKVSPWGAFADFYEANVTGTRNVIEACRKNGVRKLVYTSSPSVVFGTGDLRNVKEDTPYPKTFLAHYPRTKAEAEQLVLAANGPDLATVALRPHCIWGPGDNHLFPVLAMKQRSGLLRTIGSGDNLIDTTYVDDAAQAHVEAAKRLQIGSAPAGKAYFISQGEPRSVRTLIDDLLRAADLPPVRKSISFPAAYAAGYFFETLYRLFGIASEPPVTRFTALLMARDHYFDISAARRDLGYQPTVTIEEGMRRVHSALSAPGGVAQTVSEALA